MLENDLCDKCKKATGNSAKFKCMCHAAVRTREIGEELLMLTNERTEIEEIPKEVKKVANKSNPPVLTEKAVDAMKEQGETFAAIAKHIGISSPTLATRSQNLGLDRVRKGRQDGTETDKMQKSESVAKVESLVVPSVSTTYEAEIKELNEAVIERDAILQEQMSLIESLNSERDRLADQYKASGDL